MKAVLKEQDRHFELRPWQQCMVFLLGCAILVTRRPDAVFHAQFWGEDGAIFFADAYNLGWWSALFRTYAGYFHAVPRLGASLALLVPLSLAPLMLNLIAIAFQALPVNLLLSSRSSAWGSLRNRALLACIYLALPNCYELSATITNSQWLLALSAYLLLVMSVPRGMAGQLFDAFVLLLCGLTGPFSIFLLPIALFLAWRLRDRWRWVRAGAVAAPCLVQLWGLLNGGFGVRPHYALGASPAMFTRILAGDVFFGAFFGSNGLGAHSSLWALIFDVCIAVAGTAIVGFCLVKSSAEMKLFLAFSGMIFAASLFSPIIAPSAGVTAWEQLARGGASRYWFFPTLAFAWSIVWCFQSRYPQLKELAGYLLLLMCIGIIRDWRSPAFQDLHYAEYAKRLESASVGTSVTIPLNPAGFEMQLFKRTQVP